MKTPRLPLSLALATVLLAGTALPLAHFDIGVAQAADKKSDKKDEKKPPSISAKVAKPLKEVQDLLTAKNYQAALAKIAEAQAITGKSPYESYITDEMAGIIHVNLQDYPAAAKAFEGTVTSGQMEPDKVGARMKAVASLFYQAKDYPKAAEWAEKTAAATNDPEMAVLAGQSYYLQKQFQPAADGLHKAVAMSQANGTLPKEDWLQVLMSAEFELKNNKGVEGALEQLVTYYPKPKYWEDLLGMAQRNFKDSSRSGLDIYRLMLVTGAMSRPEEYSEMADVALKEGQPGEAKNVMDKAEAAGLLKDPAQKVKVSAAAAADQKELTAGAAAAKAQKTGDADIRFGVAFASYGQYDQAIEAIQRGIGKGVKDKDDAQLRLGIAYLQAGQRPQALDAFKAITPNTPSSAIARLWELQSAPRQTASAQ